MTLIQRLGRDTGFRIGAVISLIVFLLAATSLVWTPYDIAQLSIPDRLQAPNGEHWLGTDLYGRDIASMIMKGAANSLGVALIAVATGLVIGVPLGALAAARGGLADTALMRASDLVFAFPALLTAVMITAVAGPGAVNAIIAIGIFNIPVFARVTRGAARAIWKRDYVLAARACGKGATRITIEHVLPNIANVLIVQATIQFSLGILAEAALSYLGLGTRPPATSWGLMLAESQTMMALAPQMALAPGLAIVITVLGLNLLGDGLRDGLDPRLQPSG